MAPTEVPAGLVESALGPDDAPALVPLVEEAGWNQIAADWRFMLGEGSGVGMRDADEAWVASALSLPLGPQLCWVSMVLTAERWRRKGVGTRLLRRCLETASAGGKAAGLDATEFGRPVYLGLGFHDLYTISRWRIAGRPAAVEPPADVTIRAIAPRDMPEIVRFDTVCSGMRREHVLLHLQARVPALGFLARRGRETVGYVLGRDGRTATHIGPVVAEDAGIAMALASRAMSSLGPPFLMDAPDDHAGVAQWLTAANAHALRSYMRMLLGDAPGLEEPGRIFALAGPELG
jgi:GNAT superfamily N-acetyltransferase